MAPLLVLPGVILLAVLAELSLVHAGVDTEGILTDTASGLAFALAGLVAWHRRPSNRTGLLMTGIGISWFGGDLLFAPVPLVGPLSFVPQAAARMLYAWLLLAYPAGRLGNGVMRAAVGLVALMAGGLAVLQIFTIHPSDLCACPSSPFAVASGSALTDGVNGVGAAVGLGMAGILVPLSVWRTVRASPPARRYLIPVLAGGAFSLLAVIPQLFDYLTGATVEPFGWLPLVWIALPLGFLWGLFSARLARAAVADLVIDLDVDRRAQPRWSDEPQAPDEVSEPQAQERLQQRLANALGDPTLQVVRWSEARAAYITASGDAVDLSAPGSRRAVTMLERGEGPAMALVHDPALADDPDLLASAASAVRLAADNEKLAQEVRSQLEEVRASRARIVEAGDAERRRLERDLHDGAQQRLVALSLALRRAQGHAASGADGALAASLNDASVLIHDALEELRELARGIHPAVLTEAGLAGAVTALCSRSPVPVELREVTPERFATEVEANAYYFVSEALTNVAKHAPAARATISITHAADRLEIVVADDGPGGATSHGGSGLQGLEDRLAAIEGGMDVSSSPGRGTVIRGWIPVAAETAAGPGTPAPDQTTVASASSPVDHDQG